MKTQKFSNIKAERIINNQVCLIHQKVQSTYTSTGGNSKSDGIFDESDFEGKTYVSDRYTLIKVPKNAKIEQVQSKLDKHPDGRIYRVMAHNVEDVMTEEQLYMVESGRSDLSIAEYEEKLIAKDENGDPLSKNDKPFYRALYFSANAKEDIDMCTTPQQSEEKKSKLELKPAEGEWDENFTF